MKPLEEHPETPLYVLAQGLLALREMLTGRGAGLGQRLDEHGVWRVDAVREKVGGKPLAVNLQCSTVNHYLLG